MHLFQPGIILKFTCLICGRGENHESHKGLPPRKQFTPDDLALLKQIEGGNTYESIDWRKPNE